MWERGKTYSMTATEIKSAIEAILFASGTSVELSRIAEALELPVKEIQKHMDELVERYSELDRGTVIIRLDGSYQMTTKKEFAPYVRTVMDMRRSVPLSQAAMEVLAVVAYNQPVTKAFVEQVRGVDCSGVIGSLTTKNLIEEKGRLELPGRPLLYGTTENFLRCFSISSIDQLPPLPEKDGENGAQTAEPAENTGTDETDQINLFEEQKNSQ